MGVFSRGILIWRYRKRIDVTMKRRTMALQVERSFLYIFPNHDDPVDTYLLRWTINVAFPSLAR
jgi:hypothetical protein